MVTHFGLDAQANVSSALIVLHPNFRSQYTLLPNLLERSDLTPHYVAVPTPQTEWRELWLLLAHAFQEQADIALPKLAANTTAQKAAQQLNQVLAAHPCLLVIDAFDHANQESCSTFLAALLNHLPKSCHVALAGRAWCAELIPKLAPTVEILFYPVQEAAMLFDYRTVSNGRKLLEVYAHGQGRVVVNGVAVGKWDGHLPRALFHFFVDRGLVTRDEVFENFWATLRTKEATNVFHVTKRKIYDMIGFDLTTYTSGYYRIASDVDLRYDTATFLDCVQRSDGVDDDEALTLLNRAVSLYRGDFLRGITAEWAATRRANLRNQYVEALSGLARLHERAERYQSAMNFYARAMSIQPFREDLARSLMLLHLKQEQPKRALEVLERLETAVVRQTGVSKLDKRTLELAAKARSALAKPAR
ncbi:MAG: hypothetical protein DYG88_18200 [Chloroflexi bacterium CFX4]|nr:hypothetical protein [Chloroflexi bacterium CFX4]MDL1924403.1 hypothetical protein [Chloroflexi bacterium CFX3]